MDKIKLAIVDDHAVFRQGLLFLFRKYPEMEVVIEAEHGQDLKEKLKNTIHNIDIVILDIDMPMMDGFETTKYLRKFHKKIKIIILTHHNSEEIMLHLIELGVSGFLLKNNDIKTIIDSIYGVIENQYYFNDKVQPMMVKELLRLKKIQPSFKEAELSEREIEILILIANENNNIEIGKKLNIEPSSVDSHKKNIIKKTNAKNIIGAVMYAVKNNLLD